MLGAINTVAAIACYMILDAIAPDAAPQIAAFVVVGSIAAGVVAVVYLFIRAIYKAVTYRPDTMNESFIRIGLVQNPPVGTSFFRPDGSKIEYDKITGTWS